MSSLFLQEGQAPTVKVRPLVVFSILDAFRRRDPDCELVLGTLLGQRVNNIIEVRDAFAVPFHKGVQKQFIGEEYAQEMLALKQSVSNDEVVGSFATTVSGQGKLNLTMSQISTFYQATYNNSYLIHLVVDTEMWATAFLRPFQVQDLAKTGDAEKKQLLVEYTLIAKNEAANSKIADLTTS